MLSMSGCQKERLIRTCQMIDVQHTYIHPGWLCLCISKVREMKKRHKEKEFFLSVVDFVVVFFCCLLFYLYVRFVFFSIFRRFYSHRSTTNTLTRYNIRYYIRLRTCINFMYTLKILYGREKEPHVIISAMWNFQPVMYH